MVLRSAYNMRRARLGLVIATISALLAPAPWASAQASTPPSVWMTAADPSLDGVPGTVAVGIDPGASTLSALSADLTYDPTRVEVLSCEIAEAGACNDVGGTVKFSVFRVSRIATNEQLATISFRPITGATGSAAFTLEASQVCATEPLVFHRSAPGPSSPTPSTALRSDVDFPLYQSCSSTNSAGEFVLDGVSSGNYWISTVDPLARYRDARPVLLGIAGDDIVQRAVTVWLVEN